MTLHEVLVNNKSHIVKVLEKNGNAFLVEVNDKTVKVKLNQFQGHALLIEINGQTFNVDVQRTSTGLIQIRSDRKIFNTQCQPKIQKETIVKAESPVLVARKSATSLVFEKGAVTAPIAGRIVLINARVGDKVEKGECICILEAMKMENEIVASKAGVVNEIRISEGAIVNKGDILAIIS